MEIMLLTIALLYFVWSIAVLVFDADIWLRNKLGIEKVKVEPKENPPIPADDFIVRTFIPSHRKKSQRKLCKLSRRTRVK